MAADGRAPADMVTAQPPLRGIVRKNDRKHLARRRAMEAELGAGIFSETPTRIVCLLSVCVAGMAPTSKAAVEDALGGDLRDAAAIRMHPRKTYTIIEFGSVEAAVKAHSRLSLRRFSGILDGRPLFVEFAQGNWALEPIVAPLATTIPGIAYFRDLFTAQEEKELQSWVLGNSGTFTTIKGRLIKHFGYVYDYKNFAASASLPCDPIPPAIADLATRLRGLMPQDAACVEPVPDQLTIAIYPVATGIPYHVDVPDFFGQIVYIMSLASHTTMEFRHVETQEQRSICLEPRSGLVMWSEGRYQWQHSIRERRLDVDWDGRIRRRTERISFTMRWVKKVNEDAA